MPEDNFEQQAKELVNGFNMKPGKTVWINIEKAIKQPERKRKILLWLWLLPVCTGIFFYLYIAAQKEKKATKVTIVEAKIASPLQHDTPMQNSQRGSTGISTQNNKKIAADTTVVISSKKQIINSLHDEYKITKRPYSFAKKSKNNTLIKGAMHTGSALDNRMSADSSFGIEAGNFHKQKNTNSTNSLIYKNKAADVSDSLRNTETVVNADTVLIATAPDTALTVNNKKGDTVNAVARHNKKRNYPWHFGVMVNAAASFKNTSFLQLADKAQYTQGSDFIGTAPGRLSIRNTSRFSAGAAFGAGVAVGKQLGKKMHFHANLAYNYQSYQASVTTYKDSLSLNSVVTTTLGSYHTKQAFHFASLYTGIQWYFFTKKKVQVGLNTGIDNFLLLATKQNINPISGTIAPVPNTSSNYGEYLNATKSKNEDFLIYQPQLFTGILVNIKMVENRQLQLSPFLRNGFRKLENGNNAGSNYLFSAGLQAVYFFK